MAWKLPIVVGEDIIDALTSTNDNLEASLVAWKPRVVVWELLMMALNLLIMGRSNQ
jgi:hypothetical protein